MASITNALAEISKHRDVVPAYFVRVSNKWIVTGLNKTAGGAAVIDAKGRVESVHACKRDALHHLRTN